MMLISLYDEVYFLIDLELLLVLVRRIIYSISVVMRESLLLAAMFVVRLSFYHGFGVRGAVIGALLIFSPLIITLFLVTASL